MPWIGTVGAQSIRAGCLGARSSRGRMAGALTARAPFKRAVK
jgi:hypothetical protein